MRRIVLASTSPHRKKLLDRVGLAYETAAPCFDESVPTGNLTPMEIAVHFAEEKARSVTPSAADALVIGCDQVLDLGGEMLRKPGTEDETVAVLRKLSGRVHFLHTAVALLDRSTGECPSELTTVRMAMRTLSDAQITSYVASEKTSGSAGGYHFEGRGIALFDGIDGGDESAIVGLPLLSVLRLLRPHGIDPLG
jgi:septum formation protein